jgi:tRNA dimethylallyltransferase
MVKEDTAAACPLVVIVGPTAVGKTHVSLDLAENLNGEIVSADSRLFYKGMDIGTAKPSTSARKRVPHHLVDIVNPDQTLTLADYQGRAYAAIDQIGGRGKIAFLVGGSGQYVRAVVEGWGIPQVAPDRQLRAELESFAEIHGREALHAQLANLDPIAASRIDYRNQRRVIRALEVTLLARRPISELQAKSPPPYRILQVGLTRPRAILYERIDRRIDEMLTAGLMDEVRQLAAAGYGWKLPAMSGLGYRQIGFYLQGQMSLEESIRLLRRETRRFLRQQATWFRLDDPQIQWFDLESVSVVQVVARVRHFLATSKDQN